MSCLSPLARTPIIVDRDTGELHITGTAHPVSYYVREYAEKKRVREAGIRGNCPNCGALDDERAEFSACPYATGGRWKEGVQGDIDMRQLRGELVAVE